MRRRYETVREFDFNFWVGAPKDHVAEVVGLHRVELTARAFIEMIIVVILRSVWRMVPGAHYHDDVTTILVPIFVDAVVHDARHDRLRSAPDEIVQRRVKGRNLLDWL